jgi:hypothetical protein
MAILVNPRMSYYKEKGTRTAGDGAHEKKTPATKESNYDRVRAEL